VHVEQEALGQGRLEALAIHGPAIGTVDPPLVVKLRQVAADRLRGDAEVFGKLVDAQCGVHVQRREDAVLALPLPRPARILF